MQIAPEYFIKTKEKNSEKNNYLCPKNVFYDEKNSNNILTCSGLY